MEHPPCLNQSEVLDVYSQVKKLHAFMMRHLRSIMLITWQDKMTNMEIVLRAGLYPWRIYSSERTCAGHTPRASDRVPKQIQLPEGARTASETRREGRLIQGNGHPWPNSELIVDFEAVREAVFVTTQPTA